MNQGFAGPGQCENPKIPSRSKTTTSYWHSQVLCRAFWGQRLFVASGQPQASRMAALELNRGESALSPKLDDFSRFDLTLKIASQDLPGSRTIRSGGKTSQAGLAMSGNRKYFSHGSSPFSVVWLAHCLLSWPRWLWECPRSSHSGDLGSAAVRSRRACSPVPGSFDKGRRFPKCK